MQVKKTENVIKLADGQKISEKLSYPIDLSSSLLQLQSSLDREGIPCHGNPVSYHPTTIAQYALVLWNNYLETEDKNQLGAFLIQANWLVDHEVRIEENIGGWPIPLEYLKVYTEGSYLSALAQSFGLSVLIRAYLLTEEKIFLDVAHRVVLTFEKDILEGGISTPIGDDGVFFEEFAIYPATHKLSGFMFALLGLYDYRTLTNNNVIKDLIERGFKTMHALLEDFDTGFWTRTDLSNRYLTPPSQLEQQAILLEAIAMYNDCDHCFTLALRWKGYQHRWTSCLRYQITNYWSSFKHSIWKHIQEQLFRKSRSEERHQVCVAITDFPTTGGIRTVLAKIARLMADQWEIEYLTQHVGPDSDGLIIHKFGMAKMSPWQFPMLWLYVLSGFRKLLSLLCRGVGYQVILPQDGVFTAAFSGLAAKLAGVRVVCIDHGSVSLLKNHIYRIERIKALTNVNRLRRLMEPFLFVAYWPSLKLLALISARFVDQYLIPGIAGDGIENILRELGVSQSRIIRFASMVDIDRYGIPNIATKALLRQKKGIAVDAIVVAMVCRLSPPKGIEVALKSLNIALSTLTPSLREKVRFILAGDGPLRKQIEEYICDMGLSQTCLLWGNIPEFEVNSLLSLSDIFLYTSTRGACYSMAVLEAMASGCAVIASTEPISNALLLGEGRGTPVPSNDVEKTSSALVQLIKDMDLRCRMGSLSRDYIAQHHSPAIFKRTLLRATYWSDLDKLIIENKQKALVIPMREYDDS